MTLAGLALGVLDAWMWARGPKDAPQVKESTRWVEGYEVVADLAETVPDTRLVYGADREGDRRALMDAAARRAHPADWLVRSEHNRNTTMGEKRWDRLARSEPLGGWNSPCRRYRTDRRVWYDKPCTGNGGNRDRDPGP